MNTCPYCDDYLPQVGTTVVLCRCEGARQAELEERQRRRMWKAERSKAIAEEQERRRTLRRIRTRN